MSTIDSETHSDPTHEVKGALGLRAWGADVGHGSFLTLELGSERVGAETTGAERMISERIGGGAARGDFHVWIYMAAWRIEQPDRVLVSSEDDDLASGVTVLNGHTLESIEFMQPSLSTVFRFDGGLTLTTFSVYTDNAEHWMLYRPDGTVFTAGPGSGWSVEDAASAQSGDER